MKYRNTYPLFLLVLMSVASCKLPYTPQKEITCPKAEIVCKPEKWSGIAVDTSKSYRDTARSWFVFEALQHVNTINNEYALSMINDRTAVITSAADTTTPKVFRMPDYNRGTAESVIGGTGSPTHFGFVQKRGKNCVYASVDTSGLYSFGNSQIFIGRFGDNMIIDSDSLYQYIDPKKFGWTSQPTISEDGKVIFFASDISPSEGGTDIFFIVKLSAGGWSRPFNCGRSINTECHEITPYLSQDGKVLYFSSCGRETVGGYDIFSSNISPDFRNAIAKEDFSLFDKPELFFSPAENMKPPMNTPYDEISPCVSDFDNTLFYYSSNQQAKSLVAEKGGFDIFVRSMHMRYDNRDKIKDIRPDEPIAIKESMPLPEVIVPEIDMNFFDYTGTVFNGSTGKPEPGAELTIKLINSQFSFSMFERPQITQNQQDTVEILEADHEMENTAYNKNSLFDQFDRKPKDLNIVKTDSVGKFSVTLEKNVTYSITAQSPNLFYDTRTVHVAKDSMVGTSIDAPFSVPQDMTLRINFLYDESEYPYRFVLDSNGRETDRTWQNEIDLLARNIKLSLANIDRIELTGHTDVRASDRYNNALALKRVRFVAKQLEMRGIPMSKMYLISAGKSRPLERRPDEDEETWHKRCRRVELKKIFK